MIHLTPLFASLIIDLSADSSLPPFTAMADIAELRLRDSLLLSAASGPLPHLIAAFAAALLFVFLYNFFEIHLFRDLRRGFRGDPVSLTFHPSSDLFHSVAARCSSLSSRYLPTPWLSSPHFQTAFLTLFGRPPQFDYVRQIFETPDGGTIALDWLSFTHDTLPPSGFCPPEHESTPIVVVIPGLTSDSVASYLKHVVFKIAKRGWSVVVANHRGLGGVSVTSDRFYNAGWTEDIRSVINYLHQEHPKAPLFIVGTSIGANVLVKYLGEEGENTPISGAASVCSPWDLLICDRFINRTLIQNIYNRIIAMGLQGYAKLHQPIFSRLADWEGIKRSRSVRDFDLYATCLVGKFETVDSYYRHCSSASYVPNVAVPLLCLSAMDDPLCTHEAIPWDECRANKNVVLATTLHGGHLAFFEGLTARNLWWVRAVDEFLGALHSSTLMHRQKKVSGQLSSSPSEIDKGPYVNVTEEGLVVASGSSQINKGKGNASCEHLPTTSKATNICMGHDHVEKEDKSRYSKQSLVGDAGPSSDQPQEKESDITRLQELAGIKRSLKQLSRQNRGSVWLLAYIAIVTTWPLVGSFLLVALRQKLLNVLPATWRKKK